MYSALAMHLKCIHISRMHRFLVVIIHSEDVTENLPALHHTIYMSHAVYISPNTSTMTEKVMLTLGTSTPGRSFLLIKLH